MHKTVLPFLGAVIGAIGGPVVGDFIYSHNLRLAGDDLRAFYDCKTEEYPVTQRTNGTLQCAGVELKKLGDETAPDLRAMVDWDATQKRVADSYNSAKKARPSTFNWALGGAATAGVLQAGLSSYVQSRAERRKVKAA